MKVAISLWALHVQMRTQGTFYPNIMRGEPQFKKI